MISSVMLLLKMVVEVVVQALEILVVLTQVLFRIFLMIFLVILLVVAEEDQILGEDSDLKINIEVTLEEAYQGKKQTFEVPTSEKCSDCSGSGAASGSKPITCSTCDGHGQVRAQQGFFTIEQNLCSLFWVGKTISDPCKDCRGSWS